MADIKIRNLQIVGIDLFGGSESFLNDLQDGDLGIIQGGLAKSVVIHDDLSSTISFFCPI
jgi:hypothetical protein